MKSANKAVEISAPTMRALKRNSMRFAAVLLAVLASLVVGPNAAVAHAPQHHDQVPGFYRLKVGDLEVTALFDGPGVFDVNWLNGQKTTSCTHVQRVQLPDPKVTVVFDVDPTTAAVTRDQLLRKLASEDVLIAGPHILFPGLGRLHKDGSGYSLTPVAFTDRWEDK
jgi:hypothetical protein